MNLTKIPVYIGTNGRDGEKYYKLVQQAAKIRRKSVSAFMADAGESAAKAVLMQERKAIAKETGTC